MIWHPHKCGNLRFWRDKSGAHAVEFALVFPLFMLILFGTVEFGRMLWTSHAIHDAAIATARCMGIPQTQCATNGVYDASQALIYAQAAANKWSLQLDASAITLNHNATCANLPGFSSVTINYTFTTAVPGVITSLVGGTNLQALSCFPNH
jgi:Flp pilus assembly protein TadG